MKLRTNQKRWKKAQRAEREFWIHESRTSQYLDASGNTRLAFINQELAYFNLKVVQRYLAEAEFIVEVGCGPLGLIHFMATPAVRVGIDPLMGAMQADGYNSKHGVIRLEGRGEEIPLRADKTDLVICYNVLDHCESPTMVLAEIYRILRPGGTLLLQLHTIRDFAAIFGRILSWLDPPHPFHFSKAQVLRLVFNTGFVLEFDGSFKRMPRRFSFAELLSYDGLRHLGSNWITKSVVNLRLLKPTD